MDNSDRDLLIDWFMHLDFTWFDRGITTQIAVDMNENLMDSTYGRLRQGLVFTFPNESFGELLIHAA